MTEFTEEQKIKYAELMEIGKNEFPRISIFLLDCMVTTYVLNGCIDEDNNISNNVYETNQTEYEYEGSGLSI